MSRFVFIEMCSLFGVSFIRGSTVLGLWFVNCTGHISLIEVRGISLSEASLSPSVWTSWSTELGLRTATLPSTSLAARSPSTKSISSSAEGPGTWVILILGRFRSSVVCFRDSYIYNLFGPALSGFVRRELHRKVRPIDVLSMTVRKNLYYNNYRDVDSSSS